MQENTHFSLSPSHLDMRSEEETEKKVELLASVATALAKYDFPVPGGPNSKMPLHGVRLPETDIQRSNRTSLLTNYVMMSTCVTVALLYPTGRVLNHSIMTRQQIATM